jgi:predicted transcriptional regulator of viral defense system
MNFSQFKHQFQDYPFILSRDIIRAPEDPQAARNQCSRWQKKGLLIGLRKGVYLLNPQDRRVDVDQNTIANILYEPSYISLEYALNFYGMIPEAVADLTSVTTRKTMRVNNDLGNFIYQHIQPRAFRGFKRMGEGKNLFFMAEPEKAVVDFLYLNLSQFQNNTREILEHSYRFQNIEELDPQRLKALARLFHNKKLARVVKDLCRWIEEARE